MQTFISLAAALVIIGLVRWIKSRREKKPIKGKGFRILAPILVLGGIYVGIWRIGSYIKFTKR